MVIMSVNFGNSAFIRAKFMEQLKNPKSINKKDFDQTPNPDIEKVANEGDLNFYPTDKKMNQIGYGGIA